tara:strand:- start:124 stop:741 length:618 start_codon:yes stop_codon:yes gene_type:complete
MKLIMEGWRKFINESSLSRVRRHVQEHDCAVMTAFRGDPSDNSNCTENATMYDSDNMTRNRDLKATLLGLGFGVTKVDGSYIEDFGTDIAKEVKENSLFCVNLKDDPSFIDRITSLGEKFCQDSVLIIPRGGEGAYLVGTNNTEFPGFGNKEVVGNLSYGKESEFMTRVGNRPFTTNETLNLETYKDLSKNQRMFVRSVQKRILG